jgi:acyl-CoA thioesterase II
MGADPFADLARAMLELERVGEDLFRSSHAHDNSTGVVFGGQFLAQAIAAAGQTVAGMAVNSCSAYFLRPGGLDTPIDYAVERVRDGRAFANRRVVASQGGKVLFDMICSFHKPEAGPSHQTALPPHVPQPDDLPDIQDWLRANAGRVPPEDVRSYFQPLPMQFRAVDPAKTYHLDGAPEPRRDFWLRFPAATAIAGTASHRPLIAFVSDFWLGTVANELHHPPFAERWPVFTTSHTIAFHGDARADDWLFYRVESPWAGEGMGHTRGLLYDRAGRLIVSTTQEVVIRASG